MRKQYERLGTFLDGRMTNVSIADKLVTLLKKPSLLQPEEIEELTRIRTLHRASWKYYKEYINNIYKEHYKEE
jgi:hypothetical protein